MRYRIWYNVGAKNPGEAWVVQECSKNAPLHLAPAVEIMVPCETKVGPETPKGWMECSGQLARDGSTNAIVIRI